MESCLDMVQELPRSSPTRIEPSSEGSNCWFCVRTHPKHEHIAAAHLRQEPDVEVFLPRIRYRRSTRFGPAWVTEALFRDYVFVRFDLATALRRVRHARAVRGVVHFGHGWPTVPEAAIIELRATMGGEELRVIDDTLQPGDTVQIIGGAMHGLQALVMRVMPAKQRVAVLLDFLGRQTSVELDRRLLTFVAEEQSQRVRVPVWEAANEMAAALG